MNKNPVSVQIFGMRNSPPTRAAERFFRERRISIHFADLKQKSMAPAEIKRFTDRFGLAALLDNEGKAWLDAGLQYMKLSDAELMQRIEQSPAILRLPLVRVASHLSFGQDEAAWQAMLHFLQRSSG